MQGCEPPYGDRCVSVDAVVAAWCGFGLGNETKAIRISPACRVCKLLVTCSGKATVPLVNGEILEMMRVAHVPQSASSDLGVPLTRTRLGVIVAEKPSRSAAGKRCAAPSDWSSATLGKEAPSIEQRGSPAVDWTVPRVGGVALGVEDRKARHCDWLASEGLSPVLDRESSAR